MLFTKNLYTAIKLVHFWPFWTLFPYYLQFIFILHQIQFDTQLHNILSILLTNYQHLVIFHECKVIHKEFIYSNQIGSFLTIIAPNSTISRYNFNLYSIAPNSIGYTLTTIHYPSCQQISNVITIRVQCYSQRIYISFLTILDTISKLSSIYIPINYNTLFICSTNFRLL